MILNQLGRYRAIRKLTLLLVESALILAGTSLSILAWYWLTVRPYIDQFFDYVKQAGLDVGDQGFEMTYRLVMDPEMTGPVPFHLLNDAGDLSYAALLPRMLLLILTYQACLYYNDLYNFRVIKAFREMFDRMLMAVSLAFVIVGAVLTLFPALIISTGAFILSSILIVSSLITWRLIYGFLLRLRRFSEDVLIIGTGQLGRSIASEIVDRTYTGFNIIGFVEAGSEEPGGTVDGIPHFGPVERLEKLIDEKGASRVVLALRKPGQAEIISKLREEQRRGLIIEDGGEFYERIAGRVLLSGLDASSVAALDWAQRPTFKKHLKDLFRISVSLCGLLLAGPIMLITAALIKLESAGPVLFRQRRAGQHGKAFDLYKFRSMRADAEAESGPTWATEADPRVTRVGRFLRKTRIDELPQLINIVRGDMNYIGPRPERPFFVERLTQSIPFYSLRHLVKPGISGYAQIRYPYGASDEDAMEKLQYDLYYIKYGSVFLDLLILFDTVKVVLIGKGAR